MKIMILGAGAMGCLYGGKLKRAGADVGLIDVNAPHVEAINANGLRMLLDEGEVTVSIPAYFASQCEKPVDLVILFTKSVYSNDALMSIRPILSDKTWVLSLQNGIGHEEIIRRYVKPDHILIGTTNFPSDLTGYGEIRSHGSGTTTFMSIDGHVTIEVESIRDLLHEAGLNAQLSKDVFKAVWEKVAFNAALNTLTSITMLPQGYVGDTVEGHSLAHTVVDEVLSVARAKGIPVEVDAVHALVDKLFKEHFEHCPSMLQDVLNRRLTEVAFINGEVVRQAQLLGIKVEATKVLYLLVRIIEQNYKNRKIS